MSIKDGLSIGTSTKALSPALSPALVLIDITSPALGWAGACSFRVVTVLWAVLFGIIFRVVSNVLSLLGSLQTDQEAFFISLHHQEEFWLFRPVLL